MTTQATTDADGVPHDGGSSVLTRRRRRLLGFAIFCLVVFGLLTWRWMLAPTTVAIGDAGTADAVVVFDGGRGERLATALDLMDRGAAPVLVISNGTKIGSVETDALCEPTATTPDFEVLCPSPNPNTTQGEGRMFASLADERGWDELIAVTSTYHVTRAALAVDRCFGGDVTSVDAGRHDSGELPRLVMREWLATMNSRVLARGC